MKVTWMWRVVWHKESRHCWLGLQDLPGSVHWVPSSQSDTSSSSGAGTKAGCSLCPVQSYLAGRAALGLGDKFISQSFSLASSWPGSGKLVSLFSKGWLRVE